MTFTQVLNPFSIWVDIIFWVFMAILWLDLMNEGSRVGKTSQRQEPEGWLRWIWFLAYYFIWVWTKYFFPPLSWVCVFFWPILLVLIAILIFEAKGDDWRSLCFWAFIPFVWIASFWVSQLAFLIPSRLVKSGHPYWALLFFILFFSPLVVFLGVKIRGKVKKRRTASQGRGPDIPQGA